jgi:hypothetical protein
MVLFNTIKNILFPNITKVDRMLSVPVQFRAIYSYAKVECAIIVSGSEVALSVISSQADRQQESDFQIELCSAACLSTSVQPHAPPYDLW